MADLKTFRCDALRMTLSTAGCSRLWQSAQDRLPASWEGRAACRGCPIGARNAGHDAASAAAASSATVAADALRQVCARCLRTAERGDRRQALVNNRLCISCWNRHREAQKGRNRKGTLPRLCALLRTERLSVGPLIVSYTEVASRQEAMMMAAKAAVGRIQIGRAPLDLPVAPIDLCTAAQMLAGEPIIYVSPSKKKRRPRAVPAGWVQLELSI